MFKFVVAALAVLTGIEACKTPACKDTCNVWGKTYAVGCTNVVPAKGDCAKYPAGKMNLWCISPTEYRYCCGSNCKSEKVPRKCGAHPKPPTPPPAKHMTCGQWSVKNGGPTNACSKTGTLNKAHINKSCHSYENCRSTCCTRTPPPVKSMTCGQWSVRNGGPPNACSKTGTLNKAHINKSCHSYENCRSTCCTRTPPPVKSMTCGQWSVRNGGPPNACGKAGSLNKAHINQSCFSYANCHSSCCISTPTPPPAKPTTCGQWSAKNGSVCNKAGTPKAAKNNVACDGNSCQIICCTVVAN